MIPARAFVIAWSAAWLFAASPCSSAPAGSSPTTYVLSTPQSALEVGCQGPCECPVTSSPTYGSFTLVQTGVDPLYTYYAIENYIASFNNGPGAVAITGSGQYRIGGEVALVQQMSLDLTVEGHPGIHFDSGLQPVHVPFPLIDVSTAVHGFACYDTVLAVSAKPLGPVDGLPPPHRAAGLRPAQPNPSSGATTIAFVLDRPGRVDLTILDATGRHVRALATGEFAAAGPRAVTWDGRDADGRKAPAGTYWARLRWSGGVDSRRFVKLD